MKKIFLILIGIVFSYFATANSPNKGYKSYVDIALGDAYNVNTDQKVSINNMQWYSIISTSHGYALNNWFMGGGIGFYRSIRDKENIFPIFAVGRYTFANAKFYPYIESRGGIIYDPRWVRKVQAYGALSTGINVYKRLQLGLRLSMFSRPSRYFTANAAVVASYSIGK